MKDRMELIREIQYFEFVGVELQLYLDTHPFDQRALMDFNANSQRLLVLKQEYEMCYGPLLNYGFSPNPNSYSWQWVSSPWPWEEEF